MKLGRNDPCHCGSGKKYKHCHQPIESGQAAGQSTARAFAAPAEAGASVAHNLQTAIAHHQSGNLPLADAIYRQILQASPDHHEALHLLGLSARQQGRVDEAVQLITKSLRIKHDNPVAHFNLGLTHQTRRNFDAAIESYGHALALKPDYAEVHGNIGNVRQAQGRMEEAVASYRSALALRPAAAEVQSNLGNVLSDLGRYEEAVQSFRTALSHKPGVAEVHSNLGLALKDQGLLEEAIESFRSAIALKPDYAGAYFNLGLALQAQGKNEAAVESYRRTVALRPDYAQAHNNLGVALEASGKLGEAVDCYRRAIDLDPSLLAAYNGLNSALSTLVPLWHVPMMNDTERNEAYYAALRAAITPESNVFEIGTGSGLLSMMAARAGAKSVITCEAEPIIAGAARRVIADNALDGRIRVIAQKSTELEVGTDLPQKADILVSEIFSSELVGERVLPSIEDARRRLLTPDCRVIPAVGSIMLALFGGESIGKNMVVEDVCGFDLRHFNSIVARRQFVGRNDLDIELMSGDVEVFRFDFEKNSEFPPEDRLLRIPVTKTGRCHGLIQWIRLEMDATIRFENHPGEKTPASGWTRCVYLFGTPADLRAGQVAKVSAAHNRVFPWFALEGFE